MKRKGRVIALVLAGGSGVRMRTATPKQFLRIAGKPIVAHTLLCFEKSPLVSDIVAVAPPDYAKDLKALIKENNIKKVRRVVSGGPTRQASAYIGLKNCPERTDYVLIHDAVRPFVDERIIKDTLDAARKTGASDTVISTADTIIVQKDGFIERIPDRKHLKRGQTPQGFLYKNILKAHEVALKKGITNATDDCSLALMAGYPVRIVDGSIYNIKLTDQTDLYLAERLFQLKSEEVDEADYRSLHGKVALVVGGDGGIGSEVVTLLSKYGARPVSASPSASVRCDIADERSVVSCVSKVIKKYRRIDILVNAAGILKRSDIEKMKTPDWDDVFSVNARGAFLLSKHVIPAMKKGRGGHIVHITSSSYTRGRAGYSAYSASKAALVNFCQALADEVADKGIFVNVINPQRVATSMRTRSFGEEEPSELLSPLEVAEKIVRYCVLRETGHVVDVRTQK